MKQQILLGALGAALLLASAPAALAQQSAGDTKAVTSVPLPAGDLRPGGMAAAPRHGGDRVAVTNTTTTDKSRDTQVAQTSTR
jgi:hypothetical protein